VTRQRLLRSGMIYLTEKGYSATGLDEILKHAQVPKGSFYHYFPNKAAFGEALIDAYQAYFAQRLDAAFNDRDQPPLDRLRAFVAQAEASMARYDFRRGCLIGNLGQEMGALPQAFRARLQDVLSDWQTRTEGCLEEARLRGDLPRTTECAALAAFFWTGWEGAVLRAKLEQRGEPLQQFTTTFFALITTERPVP